MRAAPHQIHALQILEMILWPKVQHLPEIVRQIERRATVDLITVVPVGRRYHLLEANAFLDVIEADLAQLLQGQSAKASRLALPVDNRMLVRDGQQDVERAASRRRER